MTETNTYSYIIELASSSEPTPELKSYWQKRYELLLNAQVFHLSAKTIQTFSDASIVSTPVTPFGEVDLINHLDQNGMFDEMKLQITIEYAVRLLDSLIISSKFTPEVFETLNFYRKIGVGIKSFSEYLKIRPHSSEADQIDYIGGLVSNFVYRESENLATEKGVSGWWDKTRKALKPKQFEQWINTDTNEIKTALDLNETFDSQSIIQTDWQVQPRRNSHLLILPPETDWQIWADRNEVIKNPIVQKAVEPVTETKIKEPAIKESPVELPVAPETADIQVKEEELTSENPYLSALEETPATEFATEFKYIKPSQSQFTTEPTTIHTEPEAEKLLTTELISDLDHLLETDNELETPIVQIKETLEKLSPIQTIVPTHTNTISQTTMSNKYSLVLSKSVSTKSFGDVSVLLSYTSTGLKSININPAQSTPESKYLLDLVMNLVHFSLSKGITHAEVAEQIKATPTMGSNAEIVNVVVDVLSTAPTKVSEITNEIIQ